MTSSTLTIEVLARVEGEAAVTVRHRGRVIEDVQLRIFEAPRLFEAFLRGRSQLEPPDLTARICGICPIAYMMSACHAIEDAHGMVLDPELRALRRLVYCGEWIESHLLHMMLLHAPDFFGVDSVVDVAKRAPERVKTALRLKKAGNAIVRVLGGREIHPVNIKVGGFHRAPTRGELRALLPELRFGLDASRELVEWLAGLSFPDCERDWELVALRNGLEYPMNGGRIASTAGLDVDVHDFERVFSEEQVEHSHALHARIRARGAYLTGPLARFALNFDLLSPSAQETARRVGLPVPCRNPYRSLLVRGVEVIHAFEVAISIVEAYVEPPRSSLPVPVRAGQGAAATEAPRGMLFHRYAIDDGGLVTAARIVPPTSQNQAAIEADLRALAPDLVELPPEEAKRCAGQVIRNHDPCISCATHSLRLKLEELEP